jgi:hypothetical protein
MERVLGKQESLRLTELWICKSVLMIRAMNGHMATYAGCGRTWRVRGIDTRVRDGSGRQVTLKADGVDVGQGQ